MWRKIHLTEQQYDAGDYDVILKAFRMMWESPEIIRQSYFEVALLEGPLQEDLSRDMYFSPVACIYLRTLFSLYPAEDCDPPPMNTSLVMGDASFKACFLAPQSK